VWEASRENARAQKDKEPLPVRLHLVSTWETDIYQLLFHFRCAPRARPCSHLYYKNSHVHLYVLPTCMSIFFFGDKLLPVFYSDATSRVIIKSGSQYYLTRCSESNSLLCRPFSIGGLLSAALRYLIIFVIFNFTQNFFMYIFLGTLLLHMGVWLSDC
jgi:hypothetical protein